MKCGRCCCFQRASPISHWGKCELDNMPRRDNWVCDIPPEERGHCKMKATHVEGTVKCPKCRGIGAEVQHDGSKHVCRLCGGAGTMLENDVVVK